MPAATAANLRALAAFNRIVKEKTVRDVSDDLCMSVGCVSKWCKVVRVAAAAAGGPPLDERTGLRRISAWIAEHDARVLQRLIARNRAGRIVTPADELALLAALDDDPELYLDEMWPEVQCRRAAAAAASAAHDDGDDDDAAAADDAEQPRDDKNKNKNKKKNKKKGGAKGKAKAKPTAKGKNNSVRSASSDNDDGDDDGDDDDEDYAPAAAAVAPAPPRGARVPSLSVLSRTLKRLSITRRRLSSRAIEGISAANLQKRRQYVADMFEFDAAAAGQNGLSRNIDDLVGSGKNEALAQRVALRTRGDRRRLVFLDESGFDARTGQRRYGRGVRGGGAIAPARQHARSRHQSLLAAVNAHGGVVAQHVICGGFKRVNFVSFLRLQLKPAVQRLRRELGAGVGQLELVMDNASIHKGELVREVVEQELGMRLRYLAPYSPTFDPCENLFAGVKARVRRGRWGVIEAGGEVRPLRRAGESAAAAEARMRRMIKEAVDAVPARDVDGWFRLCGYN